MNRVASDQHALPEALELKVGVSKIYLYSLLQKTLKQLCETRALEKGGNKADLADRLERSGLNWGDLTILHLEELAKKHQVSLSDAPGKIDKIQKLIARLDEPLYTGVVIDYVQDETKEMAALLASAATAARHSASSFVQAFNISKDTLFSTANQLAPSIRYKINQFEFQGAYAVVHALEANQSQFSMHVHDSDQFIKLPFVTPRAVRLEIHGTLHLRAGGATTGFFMRFDVERMEQLWQITSVNVINAHLPTAIMASNNPPLQHIQPNYPLLN